MLEKRSRLCLKFTKLRSATGCRPGPTGRELTAISQTSKLDYTEEAEDKMEKEMERLRKEGKEAPIGGTGKRAVFWKWNAGSVIKWTSA